MQVPVSRFRNAFRIFSPNGLAKSARWFLFLLLLLAWALRLYHLDAMSLWWDESLSWDRATNTLPAILSNTIQIQNIATRDLHPPFYFVLLHLVTLAAGTGEFALRFLSAGANVLTLAMFVPLTRVLFGARGTRIGLLTVLFGAVSPFYVWYAQEARPYALALFLSVLCLYALLRWLKTEPRAGRDLLARWNVLFAFAFALTLATHYLSFVLLPFFALTLILFGEHERARRARIFSPLTLYAAGMVAAFGIALLLMPRETDMTSWDQVGPRFVPLFIMLRDVWNSFAVGLTMTLDQAGWLDLFLLALWLVGIFSLVRVKQRDARLALFLFCFLLLPALAVQLGSYVRPLYLNSRHLITTSPAFYIGLAVGVDALARRMAKLNMQRAARRPLSTFVYGIAAFVIALPILLGASVSLGNLYFAETFAKDDNKGWAQFLRERWRADDYLLLVAPQAEKVVEYYLPPGIQWESLPHLGQTRDWQEVLDRDAVANAYRNHARVWLLELHQPVADPTFHITDLLTRWGRATDEIIFRGISTEIRLQPFQYDGLGREPTTRLDGAERVRFTRNLELLGFDAPQEMEAGARSTMNLYFQIQRKSPRDANVSLRVVDENGAVWGQWDAPPVGSAAPLSKWEPRKTYLDQHDIVVDAGAPPGRYFIEISVYDARTNEPWRAISHNHSGIEPLRLAEINVTRPQPPRDPRTLVMDAHTDIAFGETLRLVGYDLEERITNPGSEIPLTLYFQVQQPRAENAAGRVELAAPWWQFWNRTRASAPFTLELAGRAAGEIVQTRVNVRVPGDARAGAYELRATIEATKDAAFGAVQVQDLARSMDLPPISHLVNARFDDKIEFLGYDLDAPQPLQRNDTLRVRLYWRARQAMDTSYNVFAHLVNEQDQIFGQRDKLPLDGARPTTSWAVGEIFADEYEITVAPDAPPGAYQLKIGFYTLPDFVRLPAFDANGSAVGDSILFGDLRVQ